ncbi:putative amidase signature domain-containing protein [Septoria linicola]|nr:putative amidase signature domain-containing protein [Septoria linicola]
MRTRLILAALFRVGLLTFVDGTLSIRQETTCTDNFPDLLDADLETVTAGLGSGLFNSVDLVRAYTARIQEVDEDLHVINELNPDALAIAAERDAQRANGTSLGPLHGIPILLKDNIATDDQMNNTAGSYVLLGAKVPRDSTVAAKLRAAGAILLGKANLSQWMQFRSVNTTSGWSAYGGQVKGGYVEDQEPNGSSSGSAVAASLGLAFAAIGTETLGSIVFPAAVNNVVGIKPTVGLTSRHLVIPNSKRQDTVGPIARTVKDAALILQTIAGVDERDNYTSVIPENGTIPDYIAACREDALEGARIGIPYNIVEGYSQFLEPSLLAAFDDAIQQISAAGAIIVEANFTEDAFETFQSDQNNSLVLTADFTSGIEKYLSQLTDNPLQLKNLSNIRNHTQSHPSEAYPTRDTLIWDLALSSSNLTSTSPSIYQAYQSTLSLASLILHSALDDNNASALLLPTIISAAIPAVIGSPIITVPMGAYDNTTKMVRNEWGNLVRTAPNVPFGVAFLGRKWSEKELVGFAYAFEQRTGWRGRVKPKVVPAVGLGDVVGDDGGKGRNECRPGGGDMLGESVNGTG